MAKPAVKLLIQADLIPENVLRQLVHWGLLEENSVESAGKKTSLESRWDSAEEFAKVLTNALTKEMTTLRETELNVSTESKQVVLLYRRGNVHLTKVPVDKLGRVILSVHKGHDHDELTHVRFEGSEANIPVLRIESRYIGDVKTHLVVYLDYKGDQDARPEAARD